MVGHRYFLSSNGNHGESDFTWAKVGGAALQCIYSLYLLKSEIFTFGAREIVYEYTQLELPEYRTYSSMKY